MSSRGVLYLAWGNIGPLLERSLVSLRKWHPDIRIDIQELPGDSTFLDKATMYERSPFDTTLYLDADTVVMGNLDYGFQAADKFGLACCINECPWARRYRCLSGDAIEYNAGVMFFDKIRSAELMRTWQACAKEVDSSSIFNHVAGGLRKQPYNDQAGLAVAIQKTGFNPHVLPSNWNFRPEYQQTLVGPVKVWHDYCDPEPVFAEHSEREAATTVIPAIKTTVTSPADGGKMRPKIACAMSVPRLGFMDNFFCWANGLAPLGILPRTHQGVFWGQCLETTMDELLDSDYILTVDYDSVFVKSDVEELIRLAASYPDVDCIVPIQQRRSFLTPLFSIADENGEAIQQIPLATLGEDLMKVTTAHFGLTLIKTEALKRVPHPWFRSTPDAEGKWGGKHIDEDISFWMKWQECGNSVYVANRVPIGHLESVVSWPDRELGTVYQNAGEFNKKGKPEGIWK